MAVTSKLTFTRKKFSKNLWFGRWLCNLNEELYWKYDYQFPESIENCQKLPKSHFEYDIKVWKMLKTNLIEENFWNGKLIPISKIQDS